jgi:hypothetical protein
MSIFRGAAIGGMVQLRKSFKGLCMQTYRKARG